MFLKLRNNENICEWCTDSFWETLKTFVNGVQTVYMENIGEWLTDRGINVLEIYFLDKRLRPKCWMRVNKHRKHL